MGLLVEYCQLPTLRTRLEKIANRPITLNLTLDRVILTPWPSLAE